MMPTTAREETVLSLVGAARNDRMGSAGSASVALRDATTRIAIVAKGVLLREAIGRLLQVPGRSFATACETLETVECVPEGPPAPDLFIVEIAESDEPEAVFAKITALKRQVPKARWIVLTQTGDMRRLESAADGCVDALLLSNSCGQALRLVTELVLLGHSFVPAELLRSLKRRPGVERPETGQLQAVASRPNRPDVVPPAATAADRHRSRHVSLSDREREILHSLEAGDSNKLIARQLGIAEGTVKVHVRALFRKMQVTNRTQAAVAAPEFLAGRGRGSVHDVDGDGQHER